MRPRSTVHSAHLLMELVCEFDVGDTCDSVWLCDYRYDTTELRGPDEVVIWSPTVTVRYGEYPGTCYLYLELSPNGENFTTKDMVETIGRRFEKIFDSLDKDTYSSERGDFYTGVSYDRLFLMGVYFDPKTEIYELCIEVRG